MSESLTVILLPLPPLQWGAETAPQPATGTTPGVFGTADQDWNVAASTTKDWGAEDTAGDWKEPTTTEGAGW